MLIDPRFGCCGGSDSGIGIGGGTSATMYGVFPCGCCGGGSSTIPTDPSAWGGTGFDFSNFDWSQFGMGSGTNTQFDVSQIQDTLKQGQEAAQKMFGSLPSFDTFADGAATMPFMGNMANSMVSVFRMPTP